MLSVAYIILLVVLTAVLGWYLKNDRKLIANVFFAIFILYYVLTPTVLIFYKGTENLEALKAPYLEVYKQATIKDQWRAYIITVLVAIVLIGLRNIRFVLANKGSSVKRIYNTCDDRGLDKAIYQTGKVFLLIGGLSVLVLVNELGGIRAMLSLGSTIRAYRVDNSDYLSAIGSICKTLSIFSTGSFFCFFCLWIKKKTSMMPMLVLSGIVAIITLLFDAGRGPFLLFFGCIFFAILKMRGKKVLWIVVLGFSAIVLFSASIEVVMNNIAWGRPIFYQLNYSVADNLLGTVIDLSYPYANMLVFPKMVSIGGYSYGIDYLLFFSEIIPKRLLGFFWNIIPYPTLVTTKISMYYIDSGLSIGGTPADFISYGLFQGGIIGLIINCVIYDTIIKTIDRILVKLPKEYTVIKYRICFFAYSLITSNDIRLVLKSNLFLVILLIVISKVGGVRKKE